MDSDGPLLVWVVGLTRVLGPQMVVNSKGNGTPKISGKSRLVKYFSIWPNWI